jgi:hypothetical protein
MCLVSSQKANYKVSMSKIKTIEIHAHKQKTKQGNLCHSENSHSISAIAPTIIR